MQQKLRRQTKKCQQTSHFQTVSFQSQEVSLWGLKSHVQIEIQISISVRNYNDGSHLSHRDVCRLLNFNSHTGVHIHPRRHRTRNHHDRMRGGSRSLLRQNRSQGYQELDALEAQNEFR